MAKLGKKTKRRSGPKADRLFEVAELVVGNPVLIQKVCDSILLEPVLFCEEGIELFGSCFRELADWKRTSNAPKRRLIMANISLMESYPEKAYSFTLRLNDNFNNRMEDALDLREIKQEIARKIRESLIELEGESYFWFVIEPTGGYHLHGALAVSPFNLPKLRKKLKRIAKNTNSALQFIPRKGALKKYGSTQAAKWGSYSAKEFRRLGCYLYVSTPLTAIARESCNQLKKNLLILQKMRKKFADCGKGTSLEYPFFTINPITKSIELENTDLDPEIYWD